MNVTIQEPEMTVTIATPAMRTPGGGGHPLAPEGCLTLEQGDFLPWDNPDNILSRQVMRAGALSCTYTEFYFQHDYEAWRPPPESRFTDCK